MPILKTTIVGLQLIMGFVWGFSTWITTKNRDKRALVDYIFFYSLSFMAVFCLPKAILGTGDRFDEAIIITNMSSLYHFIIIDIVCGMIIICISFVKFFRNKVDLFCKWTTNVSLTLIALVIMFRGNIITCKEVCLIYGMSCLISIAFTSKHIDLQFNKSHRMRCALPALLCWTFMHFLFLPHELYFNNRAEISIRYQYYLISSLLWIIMVSLILILFTYVLDDKSFDLYIIGTFILTFIGYIQEMFLNKELRMLSGTSYSWGNKTILINIFTWLVLAIAILLLCYRMKQWKSYIPIICGVFFLIRLITVGTLGIINDSPDVNVLTSDGSMELGNKKNVIVFVLDFYDSQIFDRVMHVNPKLENELCDFTYYDNLSSSYALTHMEVPFLLTGTEWEYDMSDWDYIKYAWENGSIPEEASINGYSVGVYTEGNMFSKQYADDIVNFTDRPTQDYSISEVGKLMFKSSKYVLMPYLYKNDYSYSTEQFAGLSNNTNEWNTSNDIYFYQNMINNGLFIGENEKCFKFFHMQGAHPEYKIDYNIELLEQSTDNFDYLNGQATGSLKIVFEYLQQLKELGSYNDATIIITADHGHNFEGVEYWNDWLYASGLEPQSNPICFVKMPGETHETMAHNSFAATQSNLIESIRASLDLDVLTDDKSAKTKQLSELDDSDNPIRHMIFRRVDDVPYREYAIKGNVHNWNNWEIVRDDYQSED